MSLRINVFDRFDDVFYTMLITIKKRKKKLLFMAPNKHKLVLNNIRLHHCHTKLVKLLTCTPKLTSNPTINYFFLTFNSLYTEWSLQLCVKRKGNKCIIFTPLTLKFFNVVHSNYLVLLSCILFTLAVSLFEWDHGKSLCMV